MAGKYIYSFGLKDSHESVAHGDLKILLGGKGASLTQMSESALPVPSGFIITTEAYEEYFESGSKFIKSLKPKVSAHLKKLEQQWGYMPLLSVRSGARVSMPGMMDTILNVGLTLDRMQEWEDRLGSRTAWDCRRRLIQMTGVVVHGIPSKFFEAILKEFRDASKCESDSDLSARDLKAICEVFEGLNTIDASPFLTLDLKDQVMTSIEAVFKSWINPRAVAYRKLNGIPEDWGTAVTIQSMVFGNMNDNSGSGVMFTRNPSSGDNGKAFGEFLPNAQGEDVVAGTRTPLDIDAMCDMGDTWSQVFVTLMNHSGDLERHYGDMQDIEFTVQDGEVFLLQTRKGKRTANAAFKIAVDLHKEGLLGKEEARQRLTTDDYYNAIAGQVDEINVRTPVAVGLPASAGVAIGRVVFTAGDAIDAEFDCILVTRETNPDDIAGMSAAKGILTALGGATSHAAVVARAMNKPCVTGCVALEFAGGVATLNGTILSEGAEISICGTTGRIWYDKVPVVGGSFSESVNTVFEWAKEAAGEVLIMSDTWEGDFTRIMTAEWWTLGPEEIMDGLKLLLEIPDRENFVVDFTPARHFLEDDDAVLWGLTSDTPLDGGAIMEDFSNLVQAFVQIAEESPFDLDQLRCIMPEPTTSASSAASLDLANLGVWPMPGNLCASKTKSQLMFDYLS